MERLIWLVVGGRSVVYSKGYYIQHHHLLDNV